MYSIGIAGQGKVMREVDGMSKLYVLNDGEITSFVEGTVCHEWGDDHVFYPDDGYFLLEGLISSSSIFSNALFLEVACLDLEALAENL